MLLNAGSQLGVYEIRELIGAGGMGEVYRARDTKLDRDVALKVLPGALAGDSRYMARFQHEAHVLASLNHPHIASIHGLEESDGVRALVMELVEGRTLADRIKSGPVPVEEALAIARQIAEALEYAHEKGIIHRDLKPANVKMTPEGTVKVLDFGLAKAVEPISGDKPWEEAATAPVSMSQPGMIIGSAEYMAPEQARGQAVDRRADIWAFGVVLFEMLTGKRTFGGATVEETLAAVLTKEPGWERLPAATPASIRRLLGRCLERNRKRRLQAIGEARIAIEEYLADPEAEPPPVRRSVLPWIVAAAFASVALISSLIYFRRVPAESPLLKYSIQPIEHLAYAHIALSPNGQLLAFDTIDSSNKLRLWLRRLDSLTAQPLAGADGALHPFWSPDSRFLGYWSFNDRALKKIDLGASSGPAPPQTLCSAEQGGATWSRDGVILFGSTRGHPLRRVNAAGGPATAVTSLDRSRQESMHLWPWFLPDGRHFLYTVDSLQRENSGIYVGALDSHDRKQLLRDRSNAEYVSTPEGGFLLFVRSRTLMAQPFDAANMRLMGEPRPVAEQLNYTSLWAQGGYTVSNNGMLALFLGGWQNQWTWFDRSGNRLGTVGELGQYGGRSSLSPDDKLLALDRIDSDSGKYDIWLIDLVRGISSRFTFGQNHDRNPVWSPDGKRIVFSSNREGVYDLYLKNADGGGKEELLLKSSLDKFATSWSPDGRFLLYVEQAPETLSDVWVLPLIGDRKPIPYLKTEFQETAGAFSPDGKWVAYSSTESGRFEVYVRRFEEASLRQAARVQGRWKISNDLGIFPQWRRDGRQLFYKGGVLNLMAAEIHADRTFEPGIPRSLFSIPFGDAGIVSNIAVTGDGQRFLILTPVELETTPVTMIVNWTKLLKP
jgi:serine/threonine protein kinase